MPPKRKKPGASIPKGCEVVSVSEVEAGVNSHAHKSGSGKSGTNLTEKDKVDFLCLLKQMSVSSEGNGNRSNPGMQRCTNPQAGHDVTIAHTDITSWSQPSTAAKSASDKSPEWEYLNFQDVLNASQKDQSATQRLQGQDIKNPWPQNLQRHTGDNTLFNKGPNQLISQAFPKPQEMTWPAPPGLQQAKFVRQPMSQPQLPQPQLSQPQLSQPQLPMPNFPNAQHQQLSATQGILPQAQSPFAHVPLPQHPLRVNLPQHQFTQAQLIPHSMSHQPVTPDSPVNSSPSVILPNSNQNPLNQTGLFMTHPGMSQPWPSSAMHPGQVQQNQVQHTLGVTAKQPFLPVQPVISSRTVTLNQQDLQFRLQQMQQSFAAQKQSGLEQPWPIKEQVPNSQHIPNPQIRPPPGLLNQNLPSSHGQKQENINPSKFQGRKDLSQMRPSVQNSAQTQEQIHELLNTLALKTGPLLNVAMTQQSNKAGLVSNSTVVQRTNVSQPSNVNTVQQSSTAGPVPNTSMTQQTKQVVQNHVQKDPNNKQVKINGAQPRSNKDNHFMDVLKAALNYIDFRGGRPHCIPCQRMIHENDIMTHLKNRNHLDLLEIHDIRLTCNDLPSKKEFFNVLTQFLEVEYDQLRITDRQMVEVNDVVLRLNNLLKQCCESFPEDVKKKLEASSIRLYGSLATGMALKENVKLNLDLNVPNKDISLKLFLEVVKALTESDSFSDVKHVMADSYSAVTVTDTTTGLPFALSLNNLNPCRLSQLILNYGKLDQRVVKLCVLFRAWGRLCKVDNAEEAAFLPHAFPILVIHFLQRLRVIPVLHELKDVAKKNDPYSYLDAESAAKLCTTMNFSLGELWVRLFHFYLYEHDVSSQVVCITQSMPFRRKETNWKARRIAIIDPFQPKRNVACHVSQVMSRYIDECFLYSFLHYAIPQTEDGPAFGSIRKVPPWLFKDFYPVFLEFQKISDLVRNIVLSTESYGNIRPDSNRLRTNWRRQLAQIPMFEYLLAMQQKEEIKIFPDIVIDDEGLPGREKKLFANWSITINQVNEIFNKFIPAKLRFRFDREIFTNGLEPPVWCRACSQVGHKRQDCPDEVMPVAENLPPLSQKDIDVLNNLCDSVCEKGSTSMAEITARDDMKDELIKFIREKFPDANLDVFGSSNNGFGSRHSDVDLCMTFADMPDGEGMDFSTMITQIGDILRSHKHVSEVNVVSMAKVPIVKFTWKKTILVDLSLYNRLGQENTKLLKAYSDIDPRVRPLVYMMKRFVKTACIGDASRGSLSSYAYTLMVLYFLQQIDPPILPVLQELSENGEPPPKKELENANVYFYSDIANLDKVWPHKKNEKTVGELWLDILDFYVSSKFHESTKVVSIRKLNPLYKVNKMWMSTNLCIEDPFDLSHNLGSGLSRRMNVHIVRCFLRARRHFGSPYPEGCPSSVEDYFFDADKLMAGKPPCDRGCRVCGHIGHIRDDCPERRGTHQEQQKPKKRQTNGTEKGNSRQGRKVQDNGRTTPSRNKSPDKRTKPGVSPTPKINDRPPANAAGPTRVTEGPPTTSTSTEKDKVSSDAEGAKKKTVAADKSGKKAVKAPNRRDLKAYPGDSESTTNPEELKAKAGGTKNKPVKSVTGIEKNDGNTPPPPKVTKEKSRTYRNSQRKGPAEGAAQKVALPAAKDSGIVATGSALKKNVLGKQKPPKTDKVDRIRVPSL